MTTLNGVEFTRTGNPIEDLKNYMSARGISETEAKSELEAEYGVAQQINNSQDENNISIDGNSFDLSDTESLLEFLKGAIAKLLENQQTESTDDSSDENKQSVTIDGKKFTLTGNPDTDAQTVANTLDITLDEAKTKLKEKLGDPSKPNSSSSDDTTSTSSSSSCSSGSSTMSSAKKEAYYKLSEAEDKFKYAADNGWHNVQDLYQQVQIAKKRYEETS